MGFIDRVKELKEYRMKYYAAKEKIKTIIMWDNNHDDELKQLGAIRVETKKFPFGIKGAVWAIPDEKYEEVRWNPDFN